MLEKILRYPLNEQMKALLEKIDSPDFLEPSTDTSSLPYHKNNPEYRVESLLKADGLSKYEKLMVYRALVRAKRVRALTSAMEIVLNMPSERESLTASERGLMTETRPWSDAVAKGERTPIRTGDIFSIYNDDKVRNSVLEDMKVMARGNDAARKRVTIVKKSK